MDLSSHLAAVFLECVEAVEDGLNWMMNSKTYILTNLSGEWFQIASSSCSKLGTVLVVIPDFEGI